MKRIIYAILATVSGLVLLFSYRTSHIEAATPLALDSSAASSSGTSSETSSDASETSGAASDSASESSGAVPDSSTTQQPDASASTGLTDGTYTGAAAQTRFGPVQVQVTISGGEIADVQVPEYPSSNPKDRQINERALPVLVSETMSAQTADIQMVSGATYTSDGYLQSLQSALDQAGG
ncbi:FMN-binding protein [Microbacterium sp. SSM24]|uniref:FMN-binding protein n=1 Tax=Microbacterium sp. SSM24 TaxID=2991714 RepID=UPI00222790DA|nr:FMN-binding protein [Microbacterium sp. SSM24]MCW3493332.1 FMN-binding protein [Microbacterium sp. SSM24]